MALASGEATQCPWSGTKVAQKYKTDRPGNPGRPLALRAVLPSSGCRSWAQTRACRGSTRGSRPACRCAARRGLPSPCHRPSRPPGTTGAGRTSIRRRHRSSSRRWSSRRRPAAAGVATARGAATVVAAGAALRLALRAAARATLGRREPALFIERALARRESKGLAAIAAGDRLVGHFAETSLRRGQPRQTKKETPSNGLGETRPEDSPAANPSSAHASRTSAWLEYTTNGVNMDTSESRQ